jgi:3-hydroxyisobutyrate dehydrogenase-like beta-hydroxyacid dehydrogenase
MTYGAEGKQRMRVALIGVGNMGEPLAANLVRRPGSELTLFDADGARRPRWRRASAPRRQSRSPGGTL